MVSVDPTFDTPERLRAFLGQFDARFIGLTGPIERVERVLADDAAYVKDEPVEDPRPLEGRRILRHTAASDTIDRAGHRARA